MQYCNDTTICIPRSTLKRVYDALLYGLECSSARLDCEREQFRAWDVSSVPFEYEDNARFHFDYSSYELRRRVVMDELLRSELVVVGDYLLAEEMI